ncbi:hypothetical protein BGZ93_001007, partial [Podila epicladia]
TSPSTGTSNGTGNNSDLSVSFQQHRSLVPWLFFFVLLFGIRISMGRLRINQPKDR